jgi:uncharacterized SAM-binding protein YcdF (DUF218 family)
VTAPEVTRREIAGAATAGAARPGRWHRRLLRAAGAAAAASLLWLAGLVWFAGAIPHAVDDPDSPTDAVVVLTGGRLRIDNGLSLLAEGKGRKLFISGVNQGVDLDELLRVSTRMPQWVHCCIELGYAADSTRGNAAETAEWMRREHYRSLRLVTSAYHMRRSLLEFRRAMPDIPIVPHPVFPERARWDAWWRSRGTALVIVNEYHKYLAALLRPWPEKLEAERGGPARPGPERPAPERRAPGQSDLEAARHARPGGA